jgi:hypothetical protein
MRRVFDQQIPRRLKPRTLRGTHIVPYGTARGYFGYRLVVTVLGDYRMSKKKEKTFVYGPDYL